MSTLQNQTFAVTGGAAGIGLETVARLRQRGAKVVVFDIAEPAGEVDHYIALNLADPQSIERAARSAPASLDGLCNIAGIPPRPGNEAAVLQVNMIGTRAFTRHLLNNLKNGASVVSIASRAGAQWRDNLPQVKALLAMEDNADLQAFCRQHLIDSTRAYGLSKEALIVWSMALCGELLGRGIRVNTVSPAAVSTGILGDFMEAFGEKAKNAVARMGRPGKPEEIAEVVCFLCQPESRWVNGVDIGMDGGLFASVFNDTVLNR